MVHGNLYPEESLGDLTKVGAKYPNPGVYLGYFHLRKHSTIRQIFFCGGMFRVFWRDQNNCNFHSSVKNMNVPQNFFSCCRIVMTGTISRTFNVDEMLSEKFIKESTLFEGNEKLMKIIRTFSIDLTL